MTNELKQEVLSEYDEKVIALAQHLGIEVMNEYGEKVVPINEANLEELTEEAAEDLRNELDSIVETFPNNFRYSNEEYLVLTDEEADEEEDRQLDSYLRECVYPEIPEHLEVYFDDEAWKRDAKIDGRGHNISTYDGCEYEETIEGTTYYIYRIN